MINVLGVEVQFLKMIKNLNHIKKEYRVNIAYLKETKNKLIHQSQDKNKLK